MTKAVGPANPAVSTLAKVPIREYAGAPSLNRVRSGDRLLRDGHAGPAVRDAQQLIADAGFDILVDGKFGGHTKGAVRAFQRAHNLQVDGIIGPLTLGALEELAAQRSAALVESPDGSTQRASEDLINGDRRRTNTPGLPSHPPRPGRPSVPPPPAANTGTRARSDLTTPTTLVSTSTFATEPGRVTTPFAADRSAREQQAEGILRANGQWPPDEGRLFVIQIDQDNPPASASRTDRAAFLHGYTGQTAVFKVEDGRMVEQTAAPLRSAAHPGQFTSRAGSFTSVDGDNTPDIAHLRSGVYEYSGRLSGSNRFNPISHSSMKVARDINHNGVIDGADENDGDFYATYLQIHEGGTGSPTSVGCQTLPPDDYRQLRESLASARRTNFTYVLVRRPNDTHGANPF